MVTRSIIELSGQICEDDMSQQQYDNKRYRLLWEAYYAAKDLGYDIKQGVFFEEFEKFLIKLEKDNERDK